MTRLTIGLLAYFALTLTAFAQEWALYTSPVDGSSLDVPSSLFENVTPAEEGNGVVFASADERILLTIYSIDNVDGLTLGEVKNLIASDGERDITYQQQKKNWFVLSGYEPMEDGARAVFYSRLAANEDRSRFAAFELVYDEAVREKVDPVIRRLSLSLKGPSR